MFMQIYFRNITRIGAILVGSHQPETEDRNYMWLRNGLVKALVLFFILYTVCSYVL